MNLKSLTIKDLIQIASFIFIAGGGWYRLNSLQIDVEELKKANIELINYRLGKIEAKVDEASRLFKEKQ